MKKYILFLLLPIFFLNESCRKNEDVSYYDDLVGKTWLLIEVLENGVVQDSCFLDNTLTFIDEESFGENFGINLCEDEAGNRTGTWKISKDEETIRFKWKVELNRGSATALDYYDIIKITRDTLILQQEIDPNNVLMIIEKTFVSN